VDCSPRLEQREEVRTSSGSVGALLATVLAAVSPACDPVGHAIVLGPPRCGNGVLEPGESCDDNGNAEHGFGCNDQCTAAEPALCGDGVVSAPEVCDTDPLYCRACVEVLGSCGDGVVQKPLEVCDTKGESPTCDIDCTPPACGDGIVNAAAGEVCDDGVNDGLLGSCMQDCTAFVAKEADASYSSCKAMRQAVKSAGGDARSGFYWLRGASAAYVTYCDMATDGGGWTLVMRAIDANYDYDDPVWSTNVLDAPKSFDRVRHTKSKYPSFNQVAFDEIRTSDVDDPAAGFTVRATQESALALFGANGGEGFGVTVASGPDALLAYFDERTDFDNRQWGCRDSIHAGLNQRALLGIKDADSDSLGPGRSMVCDWDGGARFGQRVNACHYFWVTRQCGGDYQGQGWGNFWNHDATHAALPIRQLLWVR
jgi:cysteine-rich repeat protein